MTTVDAASRGRSGPETQELADVVGELAEIVAARRRAADEDDDGPADAEVVFTANPEALAELQRRHALPRVYVEFLRRHSSHDFVASGLECAGEAAWLTPVDTVAELTACCAGASPLRPVCAVSERGHYLLDLARTGGGDCPVLYVDHRGDIVEVAAGFVPFLQRVVRDSPKGQVAKDMPARTSPAASAAPRAAAPRSASRPAPAREKFDYLSWLISAGIMLVIYLLYGPPLFGR